MSKGSGGTRGGSDKAHPNKGTQGSPRDLMGDAAYDFLVKVQQSGGYEFEEIPKALNIERLALARSADYPTLPEAKTVNRAEVDALDRFVSGEAWEMNTALREGRKLSPEMQTLSNNLDKVISRHTLTKPIVVYRASYNESVGANKSFTSTSTSLAHVTSSEFPTRHVHAYLLPKGTHYAYTNSNGEREVILPRGFNLSKYKIK